MAIFLAEPLVEWQAEARALMGFMKGKGRGASLEERVEEHLGSKVGLQSVSN